MDDSRETHLTRCQDFQEHLYKMSVIIQVRDGFEWNSYEKAVEEILESATPLLVTWDLRSMTRVPWEHVRKQITLMLRIQPTIETHIKKNVILLPNRSWKNVLDVLFKAVPPKTPVELRVSSK